MPQTTNWPILEKIYLHYYLILNIFYNNVRSIAEYKYIKKQNLIFNIKRLNNKIIK